VVSLDDRKILLLARISLVVMSYHFHKGSGIQSVEATASFLQVT
jgi:hypothetical protein